jgi:uroporphyrin-III C-methyltransferase / precorrin-2 dehydrogenase / sirohydrochlorin ferrochelatase
MSTPMPRPSRSAREAAYFPIFLALRGAPVLVVGGGMEAFAKAEALCNAGALVTVVGDAVCDDIVSLHASGLVALQRRSFEPSDLDHMRLCIVAQEDSNSAAHVAAAARRRGVLVNAVDRPELCDFIMPAVVERGPVRIAISTGGLAPALSRDLRARIDAVVPPAYARLARFCGAWRHEVSARLHDHSLRRRFWEVVLSGAEADAVLAGEEAAAAGLLAARLREVERSGAVEALRTAG